MPPPDARATSCDGHSFGLLGLPSYSYNEPSYRHTDVATPPRASLCTRRRVPCRCGAHAAIARQETDKAVRRGRFGTGQIGDTGRASLHSPIGCVTDVEEKKMQRSP